jgi:hypothetical protein
MHVSIPREVPDVTTELEPHIWINENAVRGLGPPYARSAFCDLRPTRLGKRSGPSCSAESGHFLYGHFHINMI